ncbi:hypothetical protein GCM10011379_35640 [Filimonas zeae]|uniref:Gamma-glutamylcyclotransferase AIG2-like domain-containing protein n=2 Tax=Filimonas zeae TaxID=1737353 RepID=A0A917IZK6_9BACT|nr:hypothetical protein GCM10011379_35640 [Filimonas zeae]
MIMEQVIHSLNNKKNIFTDRFGHLSYPDVSATEASLLQKQHPGHAFIVYGGLAPGGMHYNFIKNIRGQWQQCTIQGRLENKGWGADLGYAGYRTAGEEEAQAITAHILFSEDMGHHWQRLDEFVGEGYIRQLTRYTLEDGTEGVGYVYVVRTDIY